MLKRLFVVAAFVFVAILPMSSVDAQKKTEKGSKDAPKEIKTAPATKPGEPKRELVGGSVTPPEPTESVILRGRNYTLPTGLTFQQIRDEQKAVTQRQFAGARSPYTSFRVVVPLPGK